MTDRFSPWDRGAYKRFGFKLGSPASGPHGRDIALGWAVLAMQPKILGRGQMKSDDPFAELIKMAQDAMRKGASGVDLYRYRNAAAFAKSRAAAEGLTHAEHDVKITMAATALRELSIPVNVLIVEE